MKNWYLTIIILLSLAGIYVIDSSLSPTGLPFHYPGLVDSSQFCPDGGDPVLEAQNCVNTPQGVHADWAGPWIYTGYNWYYSPFDAKNECASENEVSIVYCSTGVSSDGDDAVCEKTSYCKNGEVCKNGECVPSEEQPTDMRILVLADPPQSRDPSTFTPGDPVHVFVNYNAPAEGLFVTYTYFDKQETIKNQVGVSCREPTLCSHIVGEAKSGTQVITVAVPEIGLKRSATINVGESVSDFVSNCKKEIADLEAMGLYEQAVQKAFDCHRIGIEKFGSNPDLPSLGADSYRETTNLLTHCRNKINDKEQQLNSVADPVSIWSLLKEKLTITFDCHKELSSELHDPSKTPRLGGDDLGETTNLETNCKRMIQGFKSKIDASSGQTKIELINQMREIEGWCLKTWSSPLFDSSRAPSLGSDPYETDAYYDLLEQTSAAPDITEVSVSDASSISAGNAVSIVVTFDTTFESGETVTVALNGQTQTIQMPTTGTTHRITLPGTAVEGTNTFSVTSGQSTVAETFTVSRKQASIPCNQNSDCSSGFVCIADNQCKYCPDSITISFIPPQPKSREGVHVIAEFDKDASGMQTNFVFNNGPVITITNVVGDTGYDNRHFSSDVGTARSGENNVQVSVSGCSLSRTSVFSTGATIEQPPAPPVTVVPSPVLTSTLPPPATYYIPTTIRSFEPKVEIMSIFDAEEQADSEGGSGVDLQRDSIIQALSTISEPATDTTIRALSTISEPATDPTVVFEFFSIIDVATVESVFHSFISKLPKTLQPDWSITLTVPDVEHPSNQAVLNLPLLQETTSQEQTTTTPAQALTPLGDNLVRVFNFDDTTKTWTFYDPRPLFADINTLTQMKAGNTYWIRVNNPQTVYLNGMEQTFVEGWNWITWPGTEPTKTQIQTETSPTTQKEKDRSFLPEYESSASPHIPVPTITPISRPAESFLPENFNCPQSAESIEHAQRIIRFVPGGGFGLSAKNSACDDRNPDTKETCYIKTGAENGICVNRLVTDNVLSGDRNCERTGCNNQEAIAQGFTPFCNIGACIYVKVGCGCTNADNRKNIQLMRASDTGVMLGTKG